MKRIISILLSVVMAFTLIPGVNVRAEESPAGKDAGTADSINLEGASVQALVGEEAVNIVYYDGKYTASAKGYHGPDFNDALQPITVDETVKATVTITGGKIAAIDVEHIGNDGIGASAYIGMAKVTVDGIIAAQSTKDVDVVTGATSTSKGIKEAVSLALEKAKEGAPFEDGTYVTDSVIWKTDQDTPSMAGSVLEPLTVFEVKDGKPTVTFLFKETVIAAVQSYVTDLGYFKSREDLEAYKNGDESKLIKGEVVETMKIQTQSGEVEAPKRLQFSFDNFNETQYIFLFSNIMSSDARFKISYDKATNYKGVERVELSDSELLLNEEQNVKVSAKVLPADATDLSVVWSSSDDSIVTVDENGVITALKAGNAEVRATAKNGIYGAVEIQVKSAVLNYEKTSDTTAALIGASNDTSYLKLPEKTEIDGKEYTVTSVAENAFKDNKQIRTLILPETITAIGAHAFDGTNIQNIVLANGVEMVGDFAFANITALETAVLSSGLKELGEGVFQNDTALKSVNIPETLKKISKQAFKNCSSLLEIAIPSSVQTIETEAFAGCKSLTGVVLNEGLESIEMKAFHLNSSLNNLLIPASVTSIGKQSFARNISLSYIEVKGKQVKLGSQAFALHGNGAQVLVPTGTAEVYQNAFKEAGFTGDVLEAGLIYTYNEHNGTAEITGYMGSVENLIIPETVEKDGNKYSVVSMADKVFAGNTSLRSVEVAGSVENISSYAFSQCVNLEEVVLKEGVKAIESCAFNEDTNLKRVSIPSTLQNISGSSIFSNASSLEALDISEGTTIIGYRLIASCTKIKNITIPDSVTTINQYAFSYTNIEEIIIPQNVKSIQGYILYGNTSLKKIVFKGKTVPAFVKNAFENIPETTVAVVPAGMGEAYTNALTEAKYKGTVEEAAAIDFTYSIVGDKAVITGYTGEMEIAQIPSSVEIEGNTYPVESIAAGAFKDSSYLREIVISDTIKNIGVEAFAGCANVRTINVTALTSVPVIEKDAFNQIPETAVAKVPTKSVAEFKKALTEGNFKGTIEGLIRYEIVDGKAVLSAYEEDNSDVTIPSQIEIDGSTYEVAGMEKGVFQNNTTITKVILPETITSISESAFAGALNLKSIEFSKKLLSIGEKAFYGCKNLTEIKSNGKINILPESLKKIGASAFYQNSQLTALAVPKSIERIEDYTFYGCTGFTSFELPDTLTYIGAYAFSQCKGITQFDLPKTIEYIGGSAFEKTGITKIVIPDKITELNDGLFDSSTLVEITLPKNLKSIGKNVFNRTALASVELPESVEYIGDRAFSYTQLTQIKIPDKIQSLSTYLFANCTKLTKVEMNENVKSIGNFAFQHCTSLEDQTILNYVTNIGSYAFSDTGYEEIVIPENVAVMERSIFTNSLKLKEVKFENSITTLPHSTFQGCKVLETVTLPESLEEIGAYAFNNAISIKKLVIPQYVKTIETSAFAGAASLETIVFKSPKLEVLAVGPFTKVPESVAAIVPGGSKESYQSILTNRNFPGTVQAQILNLELSETDISLIKNTSKQLSVPTPADDVEDKTITWESSDTSIATVSNTGLVQAVSPGKAKIKVSASNGVSAACDIYVTSAAVEAESISLSDSSIVLGEGNTYEVKGTVAPVDTTNRNLVWSSADSSIATVDAGGIITAVSSGKTVITVKTANGKTAEIAVTVSVNKLSDGIYRVPVKMLNETSDQASMANGAMEQEAVLIVNGDETKVYLTFQTLKVGTSNGHVTQGWYFETKEDYEKFKASGTESVRKDFTIETYFTEEGKAHLQQISLTAATGADKVYLQTYVDVMQSAPYTRLSIDYASAKAVDNVEAEAISITNQDVELEKEESLQLTASVTPKDTTLITGFTWESDNPEVASVDEKTGLLTANKTGTTTIYVYTKDNLSAETRVTVVSQAEIKDNETALGLVKDIDALPAAEDITASNAAQIKKDIEKILETYKGLYDGAKAKVTNISALDLLQKQITEVEKEIAVAKTLDEEIENLPKPEKITVSNVAEVKETVVSIRAEYEALNNAAKALVTKLDILGSVETRIAWAEQEISDAAALSEQIDALPYAGEIKFSSVAEVKAAVISIKETYSRLSSGAKELVAGYDSLAPIETKIAGLEAEISLADDLVQKISGLPALEEINYSNMAEVKKAVTEIRETYSTLKETKELVTNYSILDTLSAKFVQVEASIEEGSRVVKLINETADFDKETTSSEWTEIVRQVEEIEKAFEKLDSDGQGTAQGSLSRLIAQIKAVNQETDKITVDGLDWRYKITAKEAVPETYNKAKEAAVTAGKNVLEALDINILDLRNNSDITQLPGKIKVTVKAEGDWSVYDKDSIIVLHYKNGELIEELKGTYNEDGTISFETDSFSTFAITASVKAVDAGTPGTTDTEKASSTAVAAGAKTGDTLPYWPIAASLLSLAAAVMAFYGLARKRKTEK